jgi:hypothetical protein
MEPFAGRRRRGGGLRYVDVHVPGLRSLQAAAMKITANYRQFLKRKTL